MESRKIVAPWDQKESQLFWTTNLRGTRVIKSVRLFGMSNLFIGFNIEIDYLIA